MLDTFQSDADLDDEDTYSQLVDAWATCCYWSKRASKLGPQDFEEEEGQKYRDAYLRARKRFEKAFPDSIHLLNTVTFIT